MKEKILTSIGAGIIIIAIHAFVALILGIVVMLMWNWIMTMLFGLPTIGYIEGWGIAYLSGLLFNRSTSINTKKE